MGLDLTQISDKQFSAAVPGWNRDEVKDYLAEVAASYVPVLQENDKLQRVEAAHRTEIDELTTEVGRLRVEAEGYRSPGIRDDGHQSDILSDAGGQVTAMLRLAADAGRQIRENAERHGTVVRRDALSKAAAIDLQCQALVAEVAAARQQVMEAADNIRHVEVEVMSAAEAARREALHVIARLGDECERVRTLEELHCPLARTARLAST